MGVHPNAVRMSDGALRHEYLMIKEIEDRNSPALMRGAVLTQAGYKVAVCIIGKVDIAAQIFHLGQFYKYQLGWDIKRSGGLRYGKNRQGVFRKARPNPAEDERQMHWRLARYHPSDRKRIFPHAL